LYWYIFPVGLHCAGKKTNMIPHTGGCLPTPFITTRRSEWRAVIVTYLILFTYLSNLPFQCFKIFTTQLPSFWYIVMCVGLISASKRVCFFSTCTYRCMDRSERRSAIDWPPRKSGQRPLPLPQRMLVGIWELSHYLVSY